MTIMIHEDWMDWVESPKDDFYGRLVVKPGAPSGTEERLAEYYKILDER